jgi:hypothetical protein
LRENTLFCKRKNLRPRQKEQLGEEEDRWFEYDGVRSERLRKDMISLE